MTARSIRRAAEHKAQKAARKANQILYTPYSAAAPSLQPVEPEQETAPVQFPVSPAPSPAPPTDAPENPQPAIVAPNTARSVSQAQIDANRANAKLSSGPKSAEGKAVSSQNRRSHGFAGGFQILPWEDAKDFVVLRNELRQHYQPFDVIEQGYVNRLAEHTWVRQRSLHLQAHCYDRGCNLNRIADEKQFALLMRYQNQNERGMDKCVNQLLKLQVARRKEQIGFESEICKKAAEARKNQAHEARLRLINVRAKILGAPIPTPMHLPSEELPGNIHQMGREIWEKEAAA